MATDRCANIRLLSFSGPKTRRFSIGEPVGGMNLNTFKRLALRTLPEAALLPLKKAHYASMLRKSSGDEEPELAVLSQVVSPDDYVLDIGANFGRYTYHLSHLVQSNGRVFSMEPIPSTFEVLKSNIRKLGLRNVSCLNQAASDSPGFVSMDVPEYEAGWKNFYEARVVSAGGTIPCATLDDSFIDLPRLDFIKCDVEGHELNVLRGAQRLIRKFRPKWLIEIGGDPDEPATNAAQAFQLLQDLGYSPYIAGNRALRPRIKGERATNYFFLAT